ncbi:MAG: hypothetical protein LZT29_02681 [Pantoea stewartii]|nr:MAG: hypothetical protein LZT29_02681 [Pantoea stewartii]
MFMTKTVKLAFWIATVRLDVTHLLHQEGVE